MGVFVLLVLVVLVTAAEHVTLVSVLLLLAIDLPLAVIGLWLAASFWLATLGDFVAGWLGAFVGLCTMLIINAIARNARRTTD